MKKILVGLMILVLAPSVLGNGVGSPDNECQGLGFDFGVSKWECDDSTNTWSLDEEIYTGTSVTGDCDSADWDVGKSPADGIVVKAGNTVHYAVVGTSGTVEQTHPSLSHLTFCGMTEDVPEFGTITAGFALAGGSLGYLYLKRRKTARQLKRK